jgi:hypothetical protein
MYGVAVHGAINDGIEKGIITKDASNITAIGESISPQKQGGGIMQRVTEKVKADAAQVSKDMFTLSGFQHAETWNRGVALSGTHSMLRDMINKYEKKGMTGGVLRYMGYLERLGFTQGRAEQLLQEKGKGELTDEYLRAAVNEIHGGYTYADVPAYMETSTGRFLFKYQKWEQSKLSISQWRFSDRQCLE